MKHALMMVVLMAVALATMVAATPASALTKCDMTYTLDGWSVFYKEAAGSGEVRCDNGQRAHVEIETRGGGVTFGRSKIVDGKGEFSPIANIDEVFGNYANAEAHAGMGVSSAAQVVTKGPVSLGLHGTGNGVDLGFAFGRFTITRAGRSEPRATTTGSPADEGERRSAIDDEPIRDEELPPPAPAPEAGY